MREPVMVGADSAPIDPAASTSPARDATFILLITDADDTSAPQAPATIEPKDAAATDMPSAVVRRRSAPSVPATARLPVRSAVFAASDLSEPLTTIEPTEVPATPTRT